MYNLGPWSWMLIGCQGRPGWTLGDAPSPPHLSTVHMGRVSPPLRWQAGKVWQGMGSAVRLPPRSWWILASRPSAPWLLTGIPDAIGPLSSRSTLPGTSELPFQARAPSSTSAGMTRRAQCLQGEGDFPFLQPHTSQHGQHSAVQEGHSVADHLPSTYCYHPLGLTVICLLLPNLFSLARVAAPTGALASEPLQPQTGPE